ncbi:prolyl-tRNA synthetase [Enterococcus hirae]|nr:prolyl-tRNA synthetase [Enterococcus hirae]
MLADIFSIFGLLNNDGKDIHVYFDKKITKEPRISFQPNINTKNIFFDTNDIFLCLENIRFNYSIIDI